MIENSMTEEQINALGYEYSLHPEKYEKESEMEEIKCEQVDLIQTVKVRKHEVDTEKLKKRLREHKKFSNKEIAEKLNQPLTLVEHWFRTDDCFSIPSEDVWFQLKALLDIETDEFDKSIMEFDIKLNSFDMSNRAYHESGLSPTITTQESPKCVQVATLQGGKWDKMHDIAKRVYGTDGLAPTMHTCGGGNLEPKILEDFYKSRDVRVYEDCPTIRADREGLKVAEPLVWDEFNQQVRADSSVLGTITRNCGADLKRNGQGIIEPLALDEQNKYIRQDGIVGTLTTDGSSPKHNNRVIEPTAPNYRIRKLTPKECFRLQGVKDKDIDKVMANQSNSSGYHLAGDSICATVLVGIFAQMLGLDSETEIRKTVNQIKGDI